jgi:hypothetical protein
LAWHNTALNDVSLLDPVSRLQPLFFVRVFEFAAQHCVRRTMSSSVTAALAKAAGESEVIVIAHSWLLCRPARS